MSPDWKMPPSAPPRPANQEPAWPVYVAFSLLMVYFGAASYLLFDWGHETWYFNAQVYIGLAAVIWLVGLPIIPLLDRGSVRRGIQLSLVLSLMLHLSLFLGMVAIDLTDVADTSLNQNRERIPQRQPVVIPDYSPAQIAEDREAPREFEQPVETQDAQAEVAPLEREQLERPDPQRQQQQVEPQRQVTPEEVARRSQPLDQPVRERLEDLPSQLARQARQMEQRELPRVEQPHVERTEEPEPELSAAAAQAQRQAQALELERQTPQVETTPSRLAELQRRAADAQLPEVSASNLPPLERQASQTPQISQTEARADPVARPENPQITPDASQAELARQQLATDSVAVPRPASEAPSPSSLAATIPLAPNRLNPTDAIVPQTDSQVPSRRGTASHLPTIDTTVSDNLPRPAAGQAEAAQLRPAESAMARQEVGGDDVTANAANPGQLWARPSTSDHVAGLLEQHGARRSAAAQNEGIETGDLRHPSLGRTPAFGEQAVAGPSVKIEYLGPTDGTQAAAQAEALAAGELTAPRMDVSRNANIGDAIAPRSQEADLLGPQAAQPLPTDLAGATRGRSPEGDPGPQLQPAANSGSLPGSRTPGPSPVAGLTASADDIPTTTMARPGQAEIRPSPSMAGTGQLQRRRLEGPSLPINAPGDRDVAASTRGPVPAPVMIGPRRTSDSLDLSSRIATLPTRTPGRQNPQLRTRAAVPTEAFNRRAMRQGRGSGDSDVRPSRETEEAIERGLAFLARHQSADGRWSLRGFAAAQPENFPLYQDELATLSSDTAATGLALLAFLGAAYDHLSDGYQDEVRGGLSFLIQHQRPSGDLYIPMDAKSDSSGRLYSHGIAALALCEAYGMTQDEALREPAQRALDFIVASQDPRLGGWRYTPGQGTDTSVTGWMMLALKSGELAGLSVDPKTFDGIRRWLASAEARLGGRAVYVYNPYAPDTDQQRHGRDPSQTMTAVGALIQLYLGNRRDSQILQDSAAYLKENLPAIGTPNNPQRDTYYWYYATQVMFHMRGEYWEAWDGKLHKLLEETQVREGPAAGSWDPNGQVPDRWGGFAGRIYVTTMNLLSLEVYYRHLPLYDDVAK